MSIDRMDKKILIYLYNKNSILWWKYMNYSYVQESEWLWVQYGVKK